MRTSAGITATSASDDVLAEQPRAAALFDLGIHALVGAAQARKRGVHLGLRESRSAPWPS